MYVPWSWLKKHVVFPESDKQQTVVEKLNTLGLETEAVGKNWQFTPSPNRLDLFSWWGIAQEISILLNYPLNLPASPVNFNQNWETNWSKIEMNTDRCSQFQLVLIKNFKIHDSPVWVKDYLASNNIVSINSIIDIANLVMLETGQPLHTYDYEQLSSREVVVRNALNGETMTNLKGQQITLNNEDVVVSAGREIISLAGISGSKATSINDETTNILVEAAFFDPSSIKKTSQRLNFSTQASQYFGKGCNLPFGNYALARVVELVKEICPKAEVEKNAASWKKELDKAEKTILINHDFIEKKLGIKLSSEKVEETLKKLRFAFQTKQFTKG